MTEVEEEEEPKRVRCTDGRYRNFQEIQKSYCQFRRKEGEVDSSIERMGDSESTIDAERSELPDASTSALETTEGAVEEASVAIAAEDASVYPAFREENSILSESQLVSALEDPSEILDVTGVEETILPEDM